MINRCLAASLLLISASLVRAQTGLDPAEIQKPLADEWRTYSGDMTGKRFSSLTKVNTGNVNQLSLAWIAPLQDGSGPNGTAPTAAAGRGGGGGGGGFGGGGGVRTPTIVGGLGDGSLNTAGPARLGGASLVVDGVIYTTSPDNVWAIDAHDGSVIWHYYWKTRGGTHTGNRGVGMWHNYLYLETHDDMLVSLDARTGKERWHKEIASFDEQYFSSMMPMVIGNHLLVGTGNDMDSPGFIQSFDPETGERQWIHYNVPMQKGDPGAETWASLDAAQHGGAQVWIPGAYDPETNLYIYGTGNPTPAYTTGRGDSGNLYTCSLIAINPDTGKMAWYYQTSPHDTHDWDSTQTPAIADIPINGKVRKVVMQATRNGYFFVLDRTTGEHLVTGKIGLVNNWAKGLDAKGAPMRDPGKDATIPGSLVNGDVTNYPPPSYSPQTKLFYVEENNTLRISYLTEPDSRGSMGLGGTMGGASMSYGSNVDAIDPQTGKVVWRHEVTRSGGVLSTAGDLVFSGDGEYLIALNAKTGETLWHSKIGTTAGAPETYLLDGKQYVLQAANGSLFAFVLNGPAESRRSVASLSTPK